MKKKRLLLSLVLCISMIMAISVTAFAAPSDGNSISPNSVKLYWIKGTNVNLRSGPSIHYSSGGQVNSPDTLELRYINGSSYIDDDHGESYLWRYVHMTSGHCAGLNGYVEDQYVTSKWVNADS